MFRLPQPTGFDLDKSQALPGKVQWLKAFQANDTTNIVELGSRITIALEAGEELKKLTAGHPLELARTVRSNLFILQSPDALTAAREADRLAALPGVHAAYPVLRRQADLHGLYAAMPKETFFAFEDSGTPWEWPLENRDLNGSSTGPDLNVRAAWPLTLGQGVTLAISDTGIELTHPELAARVVGAPHYNFLNQTTNAGPVSTSGNGSHGTSCAGLAVASINDYRFVGVAPRATLASWVVIDANGFLGTDEQLMDMFQYQSNVVSVQSHSWAPVGLAQIGVPLLEQAGILNAVTLGRSGRGVVMVRSAGNDRANLGNANDHGYLADPHVIPVGAVRQDGRVASYSNPGACLLVAAPSGDPASGFLSLFTTDLVGTAGANPINYFPPYQDMNNYVWAGLGFSGTSASAPQVAGVVALMLSANTNLNLRDVQQILVLASRHYDFADPDVVTNGAGFVVSHNLGFGVPDAGQAVSLARSWTNRPASVHLEFVDNTVPVAIPDDALRVLVTGAGVPPGLASIHTMPSLGVHADSPTPARPLADFGFGTNLAGYNLTNKAALIQRGTNTHFAAQISLAAQAGATFAVVYNYDASTAADGGDLVALMGGTGFVPIPAVFIGHTDGESLKSFFQSNPSALAQINLDSASFVFAVTNTLICEEVGLRVMTDHPLRGNLRITLVSPSGTRSVLQALNLDTNAGPGDWTYYSTHHFFESTAGNWTAYVSDEGALNSGSVLGINLLLDGVQIVDQDRDGLDDGWEMAKFASLTQGPKDDPDHDGYCNAREQAMGTNPAQANNIPFRVDFSRWTDTIARISWPSSPSYSYQVWGGTNPAALHVLTNLPGRFAETEWFTPYSPPQFFRVRATLNP